MTEQEWVACDDVEVLLHFLDGRVTVRKLSLFDLACCRRIWQLVPEEFQRGPVVGEQFVDGLATRNALEQAIAATMRALSSLPREWQGTDGLPERLAAYAAWSTSLTFRPSEDHSTPPGRTAFFALQAFGHATVPDAAGEQFRQARELEIRAQVALLRHIIGNPFAPLAVPHSLPATVVALALAVYDGGDGAFALRDGLLECGLTEIGEHFAERVHPKGCAWLDAILGK